jgi:hypothetical protein
MLGSNTSDLATNTKDVWPLGPEINGHTVQRFRGNSRGRGRNTADMSSCVMVLRARAGIFGELPLGQPLGVTGANNKEKRALVQQTLGSNAIDPIN